MHDKLRVNDWISRVLLLKIVNGVRQVEAECASSDGSTFRGDDLNLPYNKFPDTSIEHRKQ